VGNNKCETFSFAFLSHDWQTDLFATGLSSHGAILVEGLGGGESVVHQSNQLRFFNLFVIFYAASAYFSICSPLFYFL